MRMKELQKFSCQKRIANSGGSGRKIHAAGATVAREDETKIHGRAWKIHSGHHRTGNGWLHDLFN
jgi:hypothetical protein